MNLVLLNWRNKIIIWRRSLSNSSRWWRTVQKCRCSNQRMLFIIASKKKSTVFWTNKLYRDMRMLVKPFMKIWSNRRRSCCWTNYVAKRFYTKWSCQLSKQSIRRNRKIWTNCEKKWRSCRIPSPFNSSKMAN
jgi:hypothetical protein